MFVRLAHLLSELQFFGGINKNNFSASLTFSSIGFKPRKIEQMTSFFLGVYFCWQTNKRKTILNKHRDEDTFRFWTAAAREKYNLKANLKFTTVHEDSQCIVTSSYHCRGRNGSIYIPQCILKTIFLVSEKKNEQCQCLPLPRDYLISAKSNWNELECAVFLWCCWKRVRREIDARPAAAWDCVCVVSVRLVASRRLRLACVRMLREKVDFFVVPGT